MGEGTTERLRELAAVLVGTTAAAALPLAYWLPVSKLALLLTVVLLVLLDGVVIAFHARTSRARLALGCATVLCAAGAAAVALLPHFLRLSEALVAIALLHAGMWLAGMLGLERPHPRWIWSAQVFALASTIFFWTGFDRAQVAASGAYSNSEVRFGLTFLYCAPLLLVVVSNLAANPGWRTHWPVMVLMAGLQYGLGLIEAGVLFESKALIYGTVGYLAVFLVGMFVAARLRLIPTS